MIFALGLLIVLVVGVAVVTDEAGPAWGIAAGTVMSVLVLFLITGAIR